MFPLNNTDFSERRPERTERAGSSGRMTQQFSLSSKDEERCRNLCREHPLFILKKLLERLRAGDPGQYLSSCRVQNRKVSWRTRGGTSGRTVEPSVSFSGRTEGWKKKLQSIRAVAWWENHVCSKNSNKRGNICQSVLSMWKRTPHSPDGSGGLT